MYLTSILVAEFLARFASEACSRDKDLTRIVPEGNNDKDLDCERDPRSNLNIVVFESIVITFLRCSRLC